MMGPNAGEEKEGQPEKKERNLLRTPLCFLSSVCQIRVGGGEERAQMDHTG